MSKKMSDRIIKINRSIVEQNDKRLAWYPYRKKPVVISAVKIDVEFEVETIEGIMKGKAGDYLIEGVKGELYPCDADIFNETYEEVN